MADNKAWYSEAGIVSVHVGEQDILDSVKLKIGYMGPKSKRHGIK